MDQLPGPLPVVHPVAACAHRPLLRALDVAYGGVEPDVEREALVAGELDAPVDVPGDVPVPEALLKPLLGVVLGDVCAVQPIQEPSEEALEGGELKEVVAGLLHLGLGAAYAAVGVQELAWLQVALASLVALVAAGARPAVGARAPEVPVREEPLAVWAVREGNVALVDIPVVH